MKHLSTYRLFEIAESDFTLFVSCWDSLEDKGFNVEFEKDRNFPTYSVYITPTGKEIFTIDEVVDELVLPFLYIDEIGLFLTEIILEDEEGHPDDVSMYDWGFTSMEKLWEGKCTIKELLLEYCQDYNVKEITKINFHFSYKSEEEN